MKHWITLLCVAALSVPAVAGTTCERNLGTVARVGFGALLALFATPPAVAHDGPCVVYANDVRGEDAAAWAARGYRLVERRDLATLSNPRRAELLDDTHFALVRAPKGDYMWLSTTGGRYVKGWTPATFAAPPRAGPIDARYACATMTRRLPFYAEGRRAVEDVFKLIYDLPLDRTIGAAVLDLERSFLVTTGLTQYERTGAQAAYAKLLAQVKALVKIYPDDFFTLWSEVRKEVYSRARSHINYCDDYASMTNALVENCVSCVGETYLLTALFLDASVRPPEGYFLGAQMFRDHARPVLYRPQTQTTYDLASGGVGPYRSSIVKPSALWRGLWLGATSSRTAEETRAVNATTPTVVYRDLACAFASDASGRHPRTASQLDGLSGCRMFRPNGAPNPHRAENEGKTTQVSFDEVAGDPRYAKTKWIGDSALGEWTGVFSAVAPNLNATERTLFEKAIATQRANEEFVKILDEAALARYFGQGHLVHRPDTAVYIVPLITVDLVAHLGVRTEGLRLSSAQRLDTEVKFLEAPRMHVVSTDAKFVAAMREASIFERLRLLVTLFARQVDGPVAALGRHPLVGEDLGATLARWHADDDARLALMALGLELGKFTLFDKHVAGGNYPEEPLNPLETTVRRLYANAAKVNALNEPVVRAFEQISKNPFEVVRWASRDPEHAARALGHLGFVTALGKVHDGLRLLATTDARFAPWTHYEFGQNILTNTLVFGVLKDPQSFYTVAPERDEITHVRPAYPTEILDPRLDQARRLNRRPPEVAIDLPTWIGLACPPGESGYFGAGVAIECARGTDDGAGDSIRTDARRAAREGEPTSGVGGAAHPGRSDRTQTGKLTAATAGRDAEAGDRLETALAPERQKIATSARAVELPSASAAAGPNDVDPRPEVHLPVYAWEQLLDAVSGDFLEEPVVQILLHHAYRQKLAAVFDAPHRRAHLRLVDFTATARPHFALGKYDWDKFKVELGPDVPRFDANLLRHMALDTLADYDPYEDLGEQRFFNVARTELARGKPGFTYVDQHDLAPSLARLHEALRAGGVVPARVVDQNQTYEVFASGASAASVARNFTEPNSNPRLEFANEGRRVIVGADNQIVGVLRPIGLSFGHEVMAYFSYAAAGDSTTADVRRGVREVVGARPFKPPAGSRARPSGPSAADATE